MKMPKEEIEVELEHVHSMLHILNERRRVLEEHQAQKGIDTEPQILTELKDIKDQIDELQNRGSELETRAVEDAISYPEAEYRVKLAQAWDTPYGRPTAQGKAQLELDRLHLGVTPERAQQLEHEIRVELAQQALSMLDLRYVALPHDNIQADGLAKQTMDIIVRAIRLDATTVLSAIRTCVKSQSALVRELESVLTWGVWPHEEDRALFRQCVLSLKESIGAHTVEQKGIMLR
jgi:hypothetical protein